MQYADRFRRHVRRGLSRTRFDAAAMPPAELLRRVAPGLLKFRHLRVDLILRVRHLLRAGGVLHREGVVGLLRDARAGRVQAARGLDVGVDLVLLRGLVELLRLEIARQIGLLRRLVGRVGGKLPIDVARRRRLRLKAALRWRRYRSAGVRSAQGWAH